MTGVAAFREALGAYRKVAVDVGVFTAYLSAEPGRGPLGLALLEQVERGRVRGVTSVVTMLALLREPHRRHDVAGAAELAMLVPSFPNLELVPLSLAIAERAARYQGVHGLAEGAAVQLATARLAGAEAIVTTDPALRALSDELEVLVLDAFAA